MPATPIAHFAINADDPARARRFYERVFGWTFTPWGPPGFYQIDTGGGVREPIGGALQQRRDLVEDRPIFGFECTVAVDDVAHVTRAATANGGRVVMDATVISGVGELVFIEDPECNVVGAMRFDPDIE